MDQGDCIFSILWVLFYEPFLVQIQSETQGYIIKVTTKHDMRYIYKTTMTAELKGITYLDDTIWLSLTKTDLENKLKIVEGFFDFTKIKINIKKSELIVINVSKATKKQNSREEITFTNHKLNYTYNQSAF